MKSRGEREDALAHPAGEVGPAVLHQVLAGRAPDWLAAKFSSQRCCQPGVAISANQSGSVGRLSRTSTDDGVRWKT